MAATRPDFTPSEQIEELLIHAQAIVNDASTLAYTIDDDAICFKVACALTGVQRTIADARKELYPAQPLAV